MLNDFPAGELTTLLEPLVGSAGEGTGADPGAKGHAPKPWKKSSTQLCWNLFPALLLLPCTHYTMYDTIYVNILYLLFKRLTNDKFRLTLLCTKCIWRSVYWILKQLVEINSFTVSEEFEILHK